MRQLLGIVLALSCVPVNYEYADGSIEEEESMAWPQTPHTTFVDNSTPYVDAAYLNAVQVAVNDLYNEAGGTGAGAFSEWSENWNLGVGSFTTTGPSPDGRWTADGFVGASTVTMTDPSVDFPWEHFVLDAASTAGAAVTLRETAPPYRANAIQNISLTGYVQRKVNEATAWNFWWGFSTVGTITADPPTGNYAYFARDTGGNWKCISHDGTAEQSTVTSTAFPTSTTARVKLRVQINGTTSVTFFINDALVATHSTRVPTNGGLRALFATFHTSGATSTMRVGPVRIAARVP